MNLFVVDQKALGAKLARIKKDGVSHLHVVSDFDRTLTPAFIDGKKPTSSFANIREEGGYLPDEYYQKAQTYYKQYYPIEISSEASLSEKKKAMTEWWEKHMGLFVQYGLNKKDIEDILRKRNMALRRGADTFLAGLAENRIPILIFSAGLGDIIKGVLSFRGAMHKNIHIISNLFEFDKDGTVVGYSKPVIHVFNKDEGQVKNSEYYEQMKGRKNVILLGDSLGDSKMLEGLSHDVVIKIVFLNKDNEKFRPQYEREFDVLILDDGPMDYVNDLLKQVL